MFAQLLSGLQGAGSELLNMVKGGGAPAAAAGSAVSAAPAPAAPGQTPEGVAGLFEKLQNMTPEQNALISGELAKLGAPPPMAPVQQRPPAQFQSFVNPPAATPQRGQITPAAIVNPMIGGQL